MPEKIPVMPEKVPAGFLAWLVVFVGAVRLGAAIYLALTVHPLGWAGWTGLAASTVFALTCLAAAIAWWRPYQRGRKAYLLARVWLVLAAVVVVAAFAVAQGSGSAAWSGSWLTWAFTFAVTVILGTGLVSHTRPDAQPQAAEPPPA